MIKKIQQKVYMHFIQNYLPFITASLVTKIFFTFILLKAAIEFYLELKNRRYIQQHQNEVPKKFQEKITLADHQKAASYSMAKINFGIISSLIAIVVLLLWTAGGGFNLIDRVARSYATTPLTTGLIFFGLYSIISFIISLPESIYSTFIIEEKFGFNKTTIKIFIIDIFKGGALGIIIGVPILAGILSIMNYLGQFWWIYAWGFLTIIQLGLLLIYPNFIAPLFNKFSPLEDGDIKNTIVALLQRVDFPHDELFVMDASKRSAHGNAYFTGFGKKKRIVFFDTLLETLEPKEIEAVLAHELGHFKKKHVFKMLIKAIAMSLLGFAILGFLYEANLFYLGHGVSIPSTYMALALFMTVSSVYTFFLTPISSWSSRKQEFEADEFASQYADPNKLISALVKMYKDNASTLTPDPLYSAYYHSHPPAIIRVNHLEQLVNKQGKSC